MRYFYGRLAVSFLSLLAAICNCSAEEKAVTRSTAGQQQKQQSDAQITPEPSNIVAKIDDYVITRDELMQRLMDELYPNGYGDYEKIEPVDVETMLKKMIADKAMAMEARKQGYLQDEEIDVQIKRFKNIRLANSVLGQYRQGKQSEITVTNAEIDSQVKANPKLKPEQAESLLRRQKINRIRDQYYNQLCEKFHLKKESQNFQKAAEIHQRLLSTPKNPRQQWWITNNQIKDDLTADEKTIVLAMYDGGKVTLKDWFNSLLEMSPPSRPKDLNTPQGVEQLLDQTLRLSMFVAEAEALGLDKNTDFIKQIRQREDDILLGKAMQEKVKSIAEPNEQQIVAYFEKNKEHFSTPNILKIDQIWCQDKNTAEKVKAELQGGKDFEAVRKEYSLQKQGGLFETTVGREGIFFKDLWKSEPNQIVGPVKGFYSDGIKWRIVKILEKKPAVLKEYSDNMKNQVKYRIMDEQRNIILANYRKELLEKYPHEIYAERIKDIDPLDAP